MLSDLELLKRSCTKFQPKHLQLKLLPSTFKFHSYLSSAIHIIFVLCEVTCVFVVVFISNVIQITLVFSIVFKIITDAVWLQVTLHFTEILIHDVNGTYHVIIQPVTIEWSTSESQIATVT